MTEESQLTYLYCVTAKEPKLEQIEALESGIYCVGSNGLYAVAAKVERREFDAEGLKKNMADLKWVRYMVGTHEKIIERITAEIDVIPFRFGTLFSTDNSLKAMLEQYGQQFEGILNRLAGKQEWGLKIYCDPAKLKAGLPGDKVRILMTDDEIKRSSEGRAYFLKKKKETMVQEALDEKISECGRKSFESLKDLSCEARVTRLLPKEVTEREDDMVLNAAFLVDKAGTDDFLDMARILKTRYEGNGFLIDCTGPWPPYNFCGLPRAQRSEVKWTA
jgi:hypothetical protein